ncbi:MAG: S8 family serine peptidase [Phycisphaerales bacterium]|nr:MAG: S8 family serine peptidase [Phycisphaerales bacterium]
MEYIIANNIRVSNHSWGLPYYSQALYDVIEASQSVGHIFVASAGNDALNIDHMPHYPASYDLPNIISVAATDNNDNLAYFSNFGPVGVDLGAPGVAIYSTSIDSGYTYGSGTSMAAPHVTGVVALLMSRQPGLTWQEVKDRIFSAVRPIDSLVGITTTGGVVNAANLLDCNGNGVLDGLDVSNGTSPDCSGNGIPDECEPDCNNNDTADSCDIFDGGSSDCNSNNIPDECEPDCNANGVADMCDVVFAGISEDCNQNVIPDECEVDCNSNGVPDDCDIADGTSEDCTVNAIPDECETKPDCNNNGASDDNDICNRTSCDCNRNGRPDECDIASGASEDCTGDVIPDECEVALQILLFAAHPPGEFLEELELAGHFVHQPSSYDDVDDPEYYDVIIWNRGSPAVYPSFRGYVDAFVAGGGGLMIVTPPDNVEEHFEVYANPAAGTIAGTVLDGTTVVDFESPVVSGLGATSTLTGYARIPDLREGAQTVVEWADGTPMTVIYRYGSGKVVYFNDASAMGDTYWEGDEAYGTALLHNALDFLALPSGDCNNNGVADSCETADGLVIDEFPPGGDGIPDECQTDCNENGVPDSVDAANGIGADCNGNDVLDECDLAEGVSTDCDDSGMLDECDLFRDCNDNGAFDACDIHEGASQDDNYNGVPDECDVIVFVDADAPSGGDGATWASAFDSLQDALAETTATELWVAAGTYTPAGPGGDPTATFLLENDIRIFGGFVGSETRLDERDPTANPTILSGDLNRDDDPPNVSWLLFQPTREDNAYHVVTVWTDSAPLLDGLTITGGNAEPLGEHFSGGGLRNFGSPTLRDCVFTANAARGGGGVCNEYDGSLTLVNCKFTRNFAHNGGALDDKGIATCINCVFDGNYAVYKGAGVELYSPRTRTLLTNCTFAGNSANSGTGLHVYRGSATLQNTILWENIGRQSTDEAAQIGVENPALGSINIDYSCVEGWTGTYGGTGNTGEDPLFEDTDGPDNTPGTPDDNLRLGHGSSCVDAGDNTALPLWVSTDWEGADRFIDDLAGADTGRGVPPIVDIGAFERLPDCNDNGIHDGEDILSGASADCNENAVPDECDLDGTTGEDCNENGIPDDCDIAFATSEDCDSNGVPDECDVNDPANDCNNNGIPDDCDIAFATSEDCNSNGVPDECDLGGGTSEDCNANDVPDECDVTFDPTSDCNSNGVPDECDLGGGTSEDCNANGVPDECDVIFATSNDCNSNNVPDECDVSDTTSDDCNANDVPDECEGDCNQSGVPDECDITLGISEDQNANSLPDECEVHMNRYILLARGAETEPVAYQVTLTDSYEFPESAGLSWWVEAPDENGVSRLTDLPVVRDWSGDLKLIYVGDCRVIPAATYEIRTTTDGVTYTDPVEVATIHAPGIRYYGDVVGVGTGAMPPVVGFTGPDGIVNVTDVQAFILTAEGSISPSVPWTWVDLHGIGLGSPPNFILNVSDLQCILFGLEGQAYADGPSHYNPANCP